MLNPTDSASAAGLSFPNPFQMASESPLSKLVEHCNKFGPNGEHKMKLEQKSTEALLLPAEMNAYSPYLGNPNWWVDQTNWHHLYPSVTSAAATSPIDQYQNYFASTPLGGLLTSSVSVAAQSAAAVATQSAIQRNLVQQNKQKASSTTSTSSGTSSGGGKYQSSRTANKCECPNCAEAEKFGPESQAARRRGVHNCHIAGCGKVYNKSSHLKAHLRWHSGERQPVRKQN